MFQAEIGVRRQSNKLTSLQIFALFDFLKEAHGALTMKDTFESLARAAESSLGFPISKYNVRGAFHDLGLKLPEPPPAKEIAMNMAFQVMADRIAALEETVNALTYASGLTLPKLPRQ